MTKLDQTQTWIEHGKQKDKKYQGTHLDFRKSIKKPLLNYMAEEVKSAPTRFSWEPSSGSVTVKKHTIKEPVRLVPGAGTQLISTQEKTHRGGHI